MHFASNNFYHDIYILQPSIIINIHDRNMPVYKFAAIDTR